MKAAVVIFPGSNCDRDVQVALRQSTGREPLVVWHKQADFEAVDLVVLPGGFSYGDYLRSGAVAARSPVMKEVVRRAAAGVPTLGICNGFQILSEAGLVPGTLMRNQNLKYLCQDVSLRVETSQSLFTSGYEEGQVIRIPIAHHDGCYFADEETLGDIEDNGQVAFRYVAGPPEEGDGNPNGSLNAIAGVFNRTKSVLGMMPHPERLSDPALGGDDGRPLFDGLVEALS